MKPRVLRFLPAIVLLCSFLTLLPSNGQDTGSPSSGAFPAWERIDLQTISRPSDRYYGWPTVALSVSQELFVVASGGRESHICPFGRVDLITSRDGGNSWSFARTICDGPGDDRDAGVIETSRGTLLVTTFTSLAYEPILRQAEDSAASGMPTMTPEQLASWQAAHRRLSDAERQAQLGTWMLRSEDHGMTWSSPCRVPVNSPHGPVNLSDGRLLYAGKSLWTQQPQVGVSFSDDDGRTWSSLLAIPTREGDDPDKYHELHAVEAADGRLIVQIRNHNATNSGETLQTHSVDRGQTWATPYSIGVWGLPSHLLRTADDRLLMSYGHRRDPLGVQLRISSDHGMHWSDAAVLYGDGVSGDLGYPSTVQFPDGTFCTVWYEKPAESSLAQLRAARWHLKDSAGKQ